jgi:DNA topoisomerase VI subunit A
MTKLEERRCERIQNRLKKATTLRELFYLAKEIKQLKNQQRQRKTEKRFI